MKHDKIPAGIQEMLTYIKNEKHLYSKKKKGLTYDELVDELHIARSTLFDLIHGKYEPPYSVGKNIEEKYVSLVIENNRIKQSFQKTIY